MTWTEALKTDINISCLFVEDMINQRINGYRKMIMDHKNAPKSALNMLHTRKEVLENLKSDLIKYRIGEIYKQQL